MLANAYLKKYLEVTGRKKEEVMRWIPVVAAKYVDVGLTEETNRRFLAIVDRFCKDAEAQP